MTIPRIDLAPLEGIINSLDHSEIEVNKEIKNIQQTYNVVEYSQI